MTGFIVIMVFFMILSWVVGGRLKSKFKEYTEVPTSSGLSGAEVAEKMLKDNGIFDVKIISTEGQLTDHYNPQDKSINLSRDVYHGRNVAAAAVAAHETGHAVQHATAYSFLQMRSALVPIVNLSSKMMNFIFIASMIFMGMSLLRIDAVLLIVVVAQAIITLFSLVTLPVEIDASNRALIWLNNANITHGQEYDKAKNALSWAAMTYVVAALAAIASLLYYLMMYLGRRD